MDNKNTIASGTEGWKIHMIFFLITSPIILLMSKFSCSTSQFEFVVLLSCLILMLNFYFYFLVLNFTQKIHAEEIEILLSIENTIKSKLSTQTVYLHEDE